ncbi:hypothetical protein SAMN02910289_01246 [Lachnospiraceae bacterium RM5]|nr:hypothetical protein SAMN02910289_01246 [Lachnospiraceae bacterium RM5]
MRKFLAFFLIFILMISCIPEIAFADEADKADESELPFELVAPGNVTAQWLGETGEITDSPTTTSISYSLSNEMTEFFKKYDDASVNGTFDDFISDYDFDEISMTTQVDWAVDDVNDSVSGWHANDFWKGTYGFGYDEEYRIRVGEWDLVDAWIGNATETVNTHWVTRYVSEDALNGNPDTMTPGLKDEMNPDQYEYKYDDGDGSLYIDYTKHTVYFRMRFVVTTRNDTDEGVSETFYYSDWSDTTSVGKDAEKIEKIKEGDLEAPVISDLRMTDKEFNDNPIVAYTLTVPDDLMEKASKVEAMGGTIRVETEARVKGDDEWTGMANADFEIKAGEMECPLINLINDSRPGIDEGEVIELRVRYYCYQPDEEDIYSDWSDVISFDSKEVGVNSDTGKDSKDVKNDKTKSEKKEEKSECSICHFCPQPLGLCIFIWLLIIVVLVVVIVVVVRVKKKD